MDMIQVVSSNVGAVGYDEFNNGTAYQYFDVPVHIFEGVRDADSVGGYLAAQIKGNYRYSKV